MAPCRLPVFFSVISVVGFVTIALQANPAIPLVFEKNLGQAPSEALYVARAGGFTIAITQEGARLSPGVTLKVVGARRGARPEAVDPLPGYSNYFTGNDPAKWVQGVRQHGKVLVADIQKGVDLVYYGKDRQLEYDLILRPGAEAGRLRIRFEGAKKLSLDEEGDLLVETPSGVLRQHKPVASQGTDRVDTSYVLGRGVEAAIRVGRYDRKRALTIDPVLSYSTYLSGSQSDAANAIAVDSTGAAYVTGYTYSTDFPATSGANAGQSDVFVTKLNPGGMSIAYSTYIGGSRSDVGNGIAVDASGNAYITGGTQSSNFPIVFSGISLFNGYSATFLAKVVPPDYLFFLVISAKAIRTGKTLTESPWTLLATFMWLALRDRIHSQPRRDRFRHLRLARKTSASSQE